MEDEDSLPERFKNVCRFCLSREELIPLFIDSLLNDYLMDAIDLLLLKVEENDGLPNAICERCYRTMVEYAKFESKAIESYSILVAALSESKPAEGENLKEMVQEMTFVVEPIQAENDQEEFIDNDKEKFQKMLTTISDESNDEQEDVGSDGLSEKEDESVELPRAQPKRPLGYRAKKMCPVCGKLVTQLSKHLPKHSDAKKFRCEYCGKQYRYITSLRKHLLIHRGIRNYQCQFCEQSFCDRSSLRYHEAKHRNERNYICTECSETFFTASQLTQHTNMNHRDRKFECKQCGCCFLMKHHRDEHMLVHTDEKPYGCASCSKTFKRKRNLFSHAVKHHQKHD